jgi:hypothetical protein
MDSKLVCEKKIKYFEFLKIASNLGERVPIINENEEIIAFVYSWGRLEWQSATQHLFVIEPHDGHKIDDVQQYI